jgi:N-acetylated-alpha-linked acidic dipeptidase
MSTFGDPGFHLHAAMGQYLSLLAFHLLDDDVLPFDLPNYAVELRAYYEDLADEIEESGTAFDISPLVAAIDAFEERAKEINDLARQAAALGDKGLIKLVNTKYRDFQRGFVSQGGLPTREFYKHVVMAPGLDTGEFEPFQRMPLNLGRHQRDTQR